MSGGADRSWKVDPSSLSMMATSGQDLLRAIKSMLNNYRKPNSQIECRWYVPIFVGSLHILVTSFFVFGNLACVIFFTMPTYHHYHDGHFRTRSFEANKTDAQLSKTKFTNQMPLLCLYWLLKFIYWEKATKFERKLPPFFQITLER